MTASITSLHATSTHTHTLTDIWNNKTNTIYTHNIVYINAIITVSTHNFIKYINQVPYKIYDTYIVEIYPFNLLLIYLLTCIYIIYEYIIDITSLRIGTENNSVLIKYTIPIFY